MISATAFILIGGNSKRFGSPKWRTMIHGESIIKKMIRACEFCDKTFLIGKNRPKDLNHISFLQDILEIQAPINGLYTALENTNTDWVLLLASDLPLIKQSILFDLLNYIETTKDIIIPEINGKLQPTCALYNKRLKNDCIKQINKHELSLTKFVNNNNYSTVDFSLQSEAFLNMNTKNDLSTAKKILSSKKFSM